MKLYLLHWGRYGWDQYSHALVVAESKEDARTIHPDGQDEWNKPSSYGTWCKSPKDVTDVTYVGEAGSHLKPGDVVIASFHAG